MEDLYLIWFSCVCVSDYQALRWKAENWKCKNENTYSVAHEKKVGQDWKFRMKNKLQFYADQTSRKKKSKYK